MKCRFSVGDIVIKARAYSQEKYCLYGGKESDLGIGSKGIVREITDTGDSFKIEIDFEGEHGLWDMDESELEPLNRPKRKLTKKQTDKKITNPTAMDLEQARENLANALL